MPVVVPELFALFGIFGHHSAATPSPAPGAVTTAVGAVKAVPIGMWIAIIGFLSAIAGPIIAHVLESRREKRK